MKRSILALLWLLVAHAASAQTLPEDARAILERVAAIEATPVGDLPTLAGDARTVADRHPRYRAILPGDGAAGLQAALDAGPADIRLCAGCEFTAGFYVTRPVSLRGDAGALPLLHGVGRPAITVWPGVRDVLIESIRATSTHQTVILLGYNDDSQTTLDLVPERIILRDVHVPTHRGKRAFEINAAEWLLEHCSALDVYNANADDQAIAVLNSPGRGTVRGGIYVAAAENILIGGDPVKVPGMIPSDILLEDLELSKPLSWRTDGISRRVKTLLELKTGNNVTARRLRLRGAWQDDQIGWAITLTPRSGGAVTNFLAEDLDVADVGGILNLTGHDLPQLLPTPARTTGIVFRRGKFEANKATFGGRGIFAMLTMGPDTLELDSIAFRGDGNHFIYGADSEPVGSVRVTNSLATVGQYGLSFRGVANLGDVSTVGSVTVTGNTFAGAASALRSKIPANTWTDRAGLDALFAAR